MISRQQARTTGARYYFTGKRCPRGHLSFRYVSSKGCVGCHREDHNIWEKKNLKRVATRVSTNNRRVRFQLLKVMGNKCACCKEARHVFLCFDHIGGGGNKHRLQTFGADYGGVRFVRWALKQISLVGVRVFKEKFRILCWNCNSAFSILGYCPHHPRRK